jgi:mannose-6-phosphate isomerase
MGAHSKAPSQIGDGEKQSLIEFIASDPAGVLGSQTAAEFDNRLPFLFKVLAAAQPLSIQAHPNLDQAREGFARENEQKIPLDAFQRNYRDDNHKPEIITALTPFWALNGFRRLDQMLELLQAFPITSLKGEIAAFAREPNGAGLKRFFETVLSLEGEAKQRVLVEVLKGARQQNKTAEPELAAICRWIHSLSQFYPGDIGILSPLLLNLIQLQPGKAMFLQAGKLHAYLQGVGIELMANSDNVIRGGLTPKHMDVAELLHILRFEGETVSLISAEPLPSGEQRYPCPAREFSLSLIALQSDLYLSPEQRSVEIAICTEGEHRISVDGGGEGRSIPLDRGQSVLISASVPRYRITGRGRIYKASVPL